LFYSSHAARRLRGFIRTENAQDFTAFWLDEDSPTGFGCSEHRERPVADSLGRLNARIQQTDTRRKWPRVNFQSI
jgi:hypothetical protein